MEPVVLSIMNIEKGQINRKIRRGTFMIKNITGIKLSGANFGEEVSLQLFTNDKGTTPSEKCRICNLYGKNGSGKSTIAHAFNSVRGNLEENIKTAQVIDKAGKEVALTEREKERVYIFNEEFIDKNVRLKSDALETVVMLGETGEFDDKLKEAREQSEKLNSMLEEKEKLCGNLKDNTNPKAPGYWQKQINKKLKGDNSWADRDSKIKGTGKIFTSVHDDTYKHFVGRNPEKSYYELSTEFDQGLRELNEARSGNKKIYCRADLCVQFNFDETTFLTLLSKKIEEPILTEREKFLLSLLDSKTQKHFHDIKDYFSQDGNNICPFCLQDVDVLHKKTLFSSIEKILNKASKDHEIELQKYRREKIVFDFTPFEKLGEKILGNCMKALEDFNETISILNEKIDEKTGNLYKPIILNQQNVVEKFYKLKQNLETLEKQRVDYNKRIDDVEPVKQKLREINSDLAFYEIEDEYNHFVTQCRLKTEEEEAKNILIEELQKWYDAIKELEEKKKNVKIAMDTINRWLRYIFFSDNRILLEYQDDKYFLKSRGNSVTPDKISAGERNALALCYFFSQLMQDKQPSEIYSKPTFLIIDDPISSFDIENRVGSLSFLKYQLLEYMIGNDETKVLIMTHDIQAFFDIQKLSKEIIEACRDKSNNSKFAYVNLELFREEVHLFDVYNRQEYTSTLKCVYNYALNGTENLELIIGNGMRRVLEAFSTFTYKKSIEHVSTDKKILQGIDNRIAPYFENLLYRLVLHGGSHMKETVQALYSVDFFDYISKEEKQRTAKDIICFLYCLNKRHVLEHLQYGENNNEIGKAEVTIEKWIEELLSKNPVD